MNDYLVRSKALKRVLILDTCASGQVPRLTEKLFGLAQETITHTEGASFPMLPVRE